MEEHQDLDLATLHFKHHKKRRQKHLLRIYAHIVNCHEQGGSDDPRVAFINDFVK